MSLQHDRTELPASNFSDDLTSESASTGSTSSSSKDFDRTAKFPLLKDVTEKVWRAAAGRTPEEKVRRAKLAKAIKPVVTDLYGTANIEAFKRDNKTS